MKPLPLRVLVVTDQEPITAAIAAVLRRRGHSVTVAANEEQALLLQRPDVLVSELDSDGFSGLDLLERLQQGGARPKAVFVTELPSLSQYRRALQLGAVDLLGKPFRLVDLVRAVEEQRPVRAASADTTPALVEYEYISNPRAVEQAARDVVAFALRCGVGPSTRARIGSAVSEIVDNARRHAYTRRRGPITVQATLEGRNLLVRVIDTGVGFDSAATIGESLASTLHNGFARATALCEDLDIESRPEQGTRVSLCFNAARVEFEDEAGVDLSELDFLTPDTARRVLYALSKQGSDPTLHLSPALAVVIGRLLAARDPRPSNEQALWS